MQTFGQQLINGLSLGSIYALLALGYTMVYGIIKLINFAHGDIYMLGAFWGYYVINQLHSSQSSTIQRTSPYGQMISTLLPCLRENQQLRRL